MKIVKAGESIALKAINRFNRIDDDIFDIALEALLVSCLVFSIFTTNNVLALDIISKLGLFFGFLSLLMACFGRMGCIAWGFAAIILGLYVFFTEYYFYVQIFFFLAFLFCLYMFLSSMPESDNRYRSGYKNNNSDWSVSLFSLIMSALFWFIWYLMLDTSWYEFLFKMLRGFIFWDWE